MVVYNKGKYWLTKLRALTAWEDEELQRASYYLLSLENAGLSDVVHTFVSVLTNRNDISSISKSNFLKKYDFFRMLLHFRNGRWIYSVKIKPHTHVLCNRHVDDRNKKNISRWKRSRHKRFV